MRRIAVINQKEGVGKTTFTANLSHALALMGYRVTVMDLDPHGHLTARLGFFRAPPRGLEDVLLGDADIERVRVKARELLLLIPAGNGLNRVEALTEGGAMRGKLLKSALHEKLRDQDFILYDCPSSAGILVMNAIFSADEVIVPVAGDYLSLSGLANILRTLKKIEPHITKPPITWIALSRYTPRKRLAKEIKNKILHQFSNKVMSTQIREASVMADCPGVGRTIFEYRKTSHSAQEFEELAKDLIEGRTMQRKITKGVGNRL